MKTKRNKKHTIFFVIGYIILFIFIACSPGTYHCILPECPRKKNNLHQGSIRDADGIVKGATFAIDSHPELGGKITIKEYGSKYYFWTREYAIECRELPDWLELPLGTVDKSAYLLDAGRFYFEGMAPWTEYTFKFEFTPESHPFNDYLTTYLETFIFEENKFWSQVHTEFQVADNDPFKDFFLDPPKIFWNHSTKGIIITTICGGGIENLGVDKNTYCNGFFGDYTHGKKECKSQLIPIDGSDEGDGPYYGYFATPSDVLNRIPTISHDLDHTIEQEEPYGQMVCDGATIYYNLLPGRYLMKVWHKDDPDQYFRPLLLKVHKNAITNACPPNGAQYLGSKNVMMIEVQGLNQGGRNLRWVKRNTSGIIVPLSNYKTDINGSTTLSSTVHPGEHLYLESDPTQPPGDILIDGDVTIFFCNQGNYEKGGNTRRLYCIRLKRENNNIIIQDFNGRSETLLNFANNDISYQDGAGDTLFLDFFHNGDNYINESTPNLDPLILINWNSISINNEYK